MDAVREGVTSSWASDAESILVPVLWQHVLYGGGDKPERGCSCTPQSRVLNTVEYDTVWGRYDTHYPGGYGGAEVNRSQGLAGNKHIRGITTSEATHLDTNDLDIYRG